MFGEVWGTCVGGLGGFCEVFRTVKGRRFLEVTNLYNTYNKLMEPYENVNNHDLINEQT